MRILIGVFFVLCCVQCAQTVVTQGSGVSRSKKLDSLDLETESLRTLAYQSYSKGELSKSIHLFEASLVLEPYPQDSWSQNLLFYAYLMVGEYKKALDLANTIVKERPFQSLSYEQVGLAHYFVGKYAQSIQNFKRALEFEVHFPRIYFYLGLSYLKAGRSKDEVEKTFREAEKEYLVILNKNPNDFHANYELASLYLFMNLPPEKAERFMLASEKALSSDEDVDLIPERKIYADFYLPILKGIHGYRKKEYPKSKAFLLEALNHAPSGARADLSEIYFYLAKVYAAMDEKSIAHSFYVNSVNTDPNGPYSDEAKRAIP